MSGRVTGIIWLGPIFHPGGYGSVSRNCLLGLQAIGFPVKAVPFDLERRDLLPRETVERLEALTGTDPGPCAVGVVHGPPDVYPRVRFRNVVRTVGYTIFETDRIPRHWVAACNRLDDVWVPSRFNFETFRRSGVAARKLRVVPYGVDTAFFSPIAETLPIPEKRGFCFLYVSFFDYRKGFDLLLEAYAREFSGAEDVSLILKTGGESGDEEEDRGVRQRLTSWFHDQFATLGKPLPHLVVLTDRMDAEGLRRLYNTCDLYISTDRANGWGMPCMEAMAMEKPAATIDWSGSTEFMKEGNSLLIRPTGRLISVDQRLARARPLYRGQRWAEVTVDEVRTVMRDAFRRRHQLRDVALRGRQDVQENFSHTRAAERIRDLVLSVPAADHRAGAAEAWMAPEPPYLWQALSKARTAVESVIRALASPAGHRGAGEDR